MARDYRRIIAWQRAHRLTLYIYRASKEFPKDEIYGLTAQLRRAAYSVAANIVEGSGRDSHKDYLRFLNIAYASLKETEYFLLLARDLGYLDEVRHEELTKQVNGTFAPLAGLIRSVDNDAEWSRTTEP